MRRRRMRRRRRRRGEGRMEHMRWDREWVLLQQSATCFISTLCIEILFLSD